MPLVPIFIPGGQELIRIAKEYNIPNQGGRSGPPARMPAIQVAGRHCYRAGSAPCAICIHRWSFDLEDKMAGRLLAYFVAAVNREFVEELKCYC